MKIIKLTAENIKRLKAVEITPDNAVVQITGPNNSGKSSVLDAIYYALAGAAVLPSQPVRVGEEKAYVQLNLGELVVTRRFTAAGGTSLVVESVDGARFPSPQAMLDKLLGKLSFDPLAFSRMVPMQQLETLRRLVPLSVDVDKIDADNAKDVSDRTDANRIIRRLEAELDGLEVPEGLPEHPVNVSDLLNQIDSNTKMNREIDRINSEITGQRFRLGRRKDDARTFREMMNAIPSQTLAIITSCSSKIVDLHEQIDALESQILSLTEKSRLAEEAGLKKSRDLQKLADESEESIRQDEVTLNMTVVKPYDDPTLLYDQVKLAEKINLGIQQRERRQTLTVEISTRKSDVETLFTNTIEVRTAEKLKAIAEAKMPIPGLAFGNGEVLYLGIPLTQASASERLRISVAIAMAANPKLRVLRIEDGSLLDEASMRLLQKMAEADDYQVWIERVDETGRVGIVMEDGSVRQ